VIRVLFLCAGNICRSPMAEAVFRHQVEAAGLGDKISADSAGTGNWHTGEQAHVRTRAVLERAGILYDGCARQVQPSDFHRFHYVMAMDRENLRAVQDLAIRGTAEVALFLDEPFRRGMTDTVEVPDPYYTGVYDEVFALVTAGSQVLLERIRAEYGL
jgi:protein-tyrosine phosphatase